MASSDQYFVRSPKQEVFVVIPETVLYADISSEAVRVYGVLYRQTDKYEGTFDLDEMAELCHMTVDGIVAAINELTEAELIR